MIRKADYSISNNFWYGKYIILIPSSYFKSVIDKRLKYIILHEYAHAKNRDTLHLIIFNIFYYYELQSISTYCKRKIIHDNEVEADRFVLNNINKMNLKLMRNLLWTPY